jgi:hypothetical protein
LSFPLITVEYNSPFIEVDWLAAGIALRVVVAVLVVYLWSWRNLHNPPASAKQGPIPEETSKTPLTNKKQGNLD